MGVLGLQKSTDSNQLNQTFALPTAILQNYNNTLTEYTSGIGTTTVTAFNNAVLTGTQTINGISVAKTLNSSDNLAGVYSYVTLSANTNLRVAANEDFGVQCWFYPTSYANTNNGNGWNAVFQISTQRGDGLLVRVGDRNFIYNGVTASGWSVSRPALNTWHFMTVRRNRTTQKCELFINGSKITEINMSNSASVSTTGNSGISVGTSYNNVQEAFNGYIADFYFIKGTSPDGSVIVNPSRVLQ